MIAIARALGNSGYDEFKKYRVIGKYSARILKELIPGLRRRRLLAQLKASETEESK
jgi:hypothetical protein